MSTISPTLLIEQPIQTSDDPQQIAIAVVSNNIPSNGTFTLSVPGPDAANTISLPLSTFSAPVLSWLVNYPANFQTTATLTYWKGPTIPPPDASIAIRAYSAVDSADSEPSLLGEQTATVF